MPRMPLSETSAKWALPCACLVFAAVWLFNAYKMGRLRLNLTYKTQLILSVVLILVANILTTLLKHWIYRSIGLVLCGLLWVIHPVLIKQEETAVLSEKTIKWVRISGVILLLIGVFTRGYFY